MFENLKLELATAGYSYISLEALQAVLDDEVQLSRTAHQEFDQFMEQGAAMFAPA